MVRDPPLLVSHGGVSLHSAAVPVAAARRYALNICQCQHHRDPAYFKNRVASLTSKLNQENSNLQLMS
jgi:hypothetical protein